MSVVTVEGLCFSYDGAAVLEEVSLSIEGGEFVALFGPNGGGKTTFLQLLLGFLKPTRGKISLFGKPPKVSRPKIGWVPQNFQFDRLFPISVEEVVLGGRLKQARPWFHAEDHRIVKEVLDRVGMGHTLYSPFAVLSGGQQQRVLIARALASRPSLILLDEPTASVDAVAEMEIYRLLNELRGEMTILMVTHDLNRAVETVDRLFCIQNRVTQMAKEKVCEHFALGLYHPKRDFVDFSSSRSERGGR